MAVLKKHKTIPATVIVTGAGGENGQFSTARRWNQVWVV
jgi:hypothetical protein